MDKIYVVFWTQGGNTQAMAEAIGEGIREAGKEAEVVFVTGANLDELKAAPKFALGCPAMGAEVLEESEMEPFVCDVEGFASGKKIALFGSYGWGGQSAGLVNDGLEACKFQIVMEPVKVQYIPSEAFLKELSEKVAALD